MGFERYGIRRRGAAIAAACTCALVAAALLAGQARAGEVTYYELSGPRQGLAYLAGPASASRVTAWTDLERKLAIVLEPGALMYPGIFDLGATAFTLDHCELGFGRAHCEASPHDQILDLNLALGPGDDRARLGRMTIGSIFAGAGDDRIFGSGGLNGFVGGPGADRVFGGGDSRDTMDYTEGAPQDVGVRVTLDDLPGDGAPGEGDNVHSDVENVNGTLLGNDLLVGTPAANRLWGFAGQDRLSGHAGDDWLRGDSGSDRLLGGPGSDDLDGFGGEDLIVSRDHHADVVHCGEGEDEVVADLLDVLSDCESVSLG